VRRMEDLELMQRVARRDQAAFRSLYARYADQLYRFALARLRSEGAAQDVVQETFLTVWQQAERYAGLASLRTYLCGICHHKVLDYERRRGRELALASPLEELASTSPPPEAGLTAAEALQSLPREMSSVLILAFHVGLRYEEIAQVLQIPVGTVKSRVYQARRRLQAMLKGDEPGV
jgi:RNA polymerase sigma-70 factor (ECF subfamily)